MEGPVRKILAIIQDEIVSTTGEFAAAQGAPPDEADYAADIIRKLGREYFPGETWEMEQPI